MSGINDHLAALGKEMLQAARKGQAERIRELAAHEAALLHHTDPEGATPLHHAAWKGHQHVVDALLELGANVNHQSSNTHYGGTPLHAAAHGNQKAVAERLLQAGADLHAVSCNGRTALEETALHGAAAVAKLLKKHGAL